MGKFYATFFKKKISLYWNARAHWIFYKANTTYGLRLAVIAKIFNVPVKKFTVKKSQRI